MESEKSFTSEKDLGYESLKRFFENQILPNLSEEDRGFIETFRGLEYGKEVLRGEYEKFMQYDPNSDNGNDFFSSVLMPLYLITNSGEGSSFNGLKESFIEKAKVFAEILYRDAFFRNRYDSLEAWRSCSRFKDYRKLLESLGLLPEGAEERIAKMSRELDALWSQPEIESEFRSSIADEYTDSGVNDGSMLDKILREDSQPISKAEYAGYHDMRPDLFPERYEDYLQDLEDSRHPYILKL